MFSNLFPFYPQVSAVVNLPYKLQPSQLCGCKSTHVGLSINLYTPEDQEHNLNNRGHPLKIFNMITNL